MAVTGVMDEVKVVLKFTKGSQTIPHCNQQAPDEKLHSLGRAIASLNAESLDQITKVVETVLLIEG